MGQPWRAPARGGRRRRGRSSLNQSEQIPGWPICRFCGTVGSRPAGRVRRGPRPAATTREPLRDDTWRSRLPRGQRVSACTTSEFTRVHQRRGRLDRGAGTFRARDQQRRGRHVPHKTKTYSTNRRRTRFFFASAASKRSLNVSPTCCMANFSFSASSSSSNDQGTRDTGGRRVRRLGM